MQQAILIFEKKNFKGYFQLKTENEHRHWILHIRMNLSTNSQHKLAILIFWTKFPPKWYSQSKIDKMNTTIEFCTFELVFESNFNLNNLEFLNQNCPKRIFMVKTENVNIVIEFYIFEIVSVPNFSLNWKLWFFGANLLKKHISGLKQKKWISPLNPAYSN